MCVIECIQSDHGQNVFGGLPLFADPLSIPNCLALRKDDMANQDLMCSPLIVASPENGTYT